MLQASRTSIPAGTWTIDQARSRVGFSVRHLMVATVRGRFNAFEGNLASDFGGLTGATGVVGAASIDTGDPKRDERLRGQSFLDVERSPWINFASRRIESGDGDRFEIDGELTIKRIRRPLALQAALRYASAELGELHVEAHGELLRSEYGLSWSEVLEAAGALVSDRVSVAVEIVAVRAQPAGT